ncbi:hypothetical protein HRG_001970 [Hirsutella rhossiliensis]|uniref:Uncharacterized protein n=1 Tax=Hirsutella rhossiliensis TaxID=111463 RepID=A0A9P8SMW5_9HYPO|nr:uncharacterized protein HRG_01970 [Hirsutella rhossiliensis]KAH0966561.1 hypothetical protein HRG_01970 [Hirsutella rhossiliensis]
MIEVRHRLPRSHPLSKRRIRVILRTSRSQSSPPQESHKPPRRSLIRIKIRPRVDGSGTTGRGQENPVAKNEPMDECFDNTGLIHIPAAASPPPLPVIQMRLDTTQLSYEADESGGAIDPDSLVIKEEPGFGAGSP